MRTGRISGAAAVFVVAAGALVGGAGTASAATPAAFCLHGTAAICATWEGASNPVGMFSYPQGGAQAWLYNGPYHPGQIQLAYTSLCMQLDHNAGNKVIVATCNGASYQKWEAIDFGNALVYQSQWDTSQCLTYNADNQWLDTVECNGQWYQDFSITITTG